MPFTPFHMGPGAAIKAVTGSYFSLTVFGFTQIAIDIEPLIRILQKDTVVHGFTHTYIGAFLIGTISMVLGKFVCEKMLKTWNLSINFKFLKWLKIKEQISLFAASTGAFIGSFSHIFLDSIIHSDIQPFAPFNTENGLLHIMPSGWLYLLCSVLGFIGFLVIGVLSFWNKWAIEIK